jgi:pantoate--beta-alanine ligase
MECIKKKAELRQILSDIRKTKTITGFVPTMGALHQGHIALVNRSVKENNLTVSSIFVNPTQFNNPDDLKKYPKTPEKDMMMLEKAGCDIVFCPEVEEMYPPGEKIQAKYNFGNLETVMEGKFRPGHFNGVATIVRKLFEIVEPDRAYFGKKDFQQLAVVKDLVRQIQSPVTIIPCETIRENDGLAMSSRNMRLNDEQRKTAPEIYRILTEAKNLAGIKTPLEIRKFVEQKISSFSLFRLEYFDLVFSDSLESVNSWKKTGGITACIAVYMDNVRLIDNIEI